jgi:hypothetical protein
MTKESLQVIIFSWTITFSQVGAHRDMKNNFKDSPRNAGWKTISQKKFVTCQEKKKPQISKPVKCILTILIRNS